MINDNPLLFDLCMDTRSQFALIIDFVLQGLNGYMVRSYVLESNQDRVATILAQFGSKCDLQ